MSAGKKAKANFEKAAKKKPDPAGLAIGKEAQAALVQKDYSKAKELFEKARNICEASAVRATKAAKSVRKTNSGGENLSAVIQCSATLQDDADREIILPPPGSEGHLFAKHKANLPPLSLIHI